MLNTATAGRGNLLLNIGPKPDGSVPDEAVAPLTTVGAWLAENGEAAYGRKEKSRFGASSGVCGTTFDGNTIYFWNWIWPTGGSMAFGGFTTPVKKITLLNRNTPVQFEQRGQRIILKGLPARSPDATAGVAVFAVEFREPPVFNHCSYYPQLHGGMDLAGDNKI